MPVSRDFKLLDLVCCPITQSKLEFVDRETLARVNQQIADGAVYNRLGNVVQEPLEDGLLNADRSWLLPIRGGIVVMVVDQAIDFAAFETEEHVDE